ncbi:DNA repair protein REV1 [Ilyonectria robusta]
MQPPPSGQPSQAAAPRYGASFDPWNSSSTGHQRPENTPGIGWRDSRNRKLNSQFGGGVSCGAGSEDWDDKHKTLIPKAVRERAQRSVRDMLVQPGKMRESLAKESSNESSKESSNESLADGSEAKNLTGEEALMEKRRLQDQDHNDRMRTRGLFDGVVVYVNGSTFPLVSDHKLKHLLTENGGQMSLHLGRRRVTHVVIGRPAGRGAAPGTGGGLAGSKLDKEIKKIGGAGVKFVGVEW